LKVFNPRFTVVSRGLPINAAVLIVAISDVIVQNVHQAGHLAENQDLEALFEQLW